MERGEGEISPISWLGIARLACRVLYDSHHPLLCLCTLRFVQMINTLQMSLSDDLILF